MSNYDISRSFYEAEGGSIHFTETIAQGDFTNRDQVQLWSHSVRICNYVWEKSLGTRKEIIKASGKPLKAKPVLVESTTSLKRNLGLRMVECQQRFAFLLLLVCFLVLVPLTTGKHKQQHTYLSSFQFLNICRF